MSLDDTPPVQNIRCAKCGSLATLGTPFCSNCGNNLSYQYVPQAQVMRKRLTGSQIVGWICVGVIVLLAVVALVAGPDRDSLDNIILASDIPSPLRIKEYPVPRTLFRSAPRTTDKTKYYEIISGPDDKNEVGFIALLQYPTDDVTEMAYRGMMSDGIEVADVKAEPIEGLGQRGRGTPPNSEWNKSEVIFTACNTVVHVSIPIGIEGATSIARSAYDRISATCT